MGVWNPSIFIQIDALVRASALSNLGEVCQNLRFSIGGIANEVKKLMLGLRYRLRESYFVQIVLYIFKISLFD